jgi:hypothetical protein
VIGIAADDVGRDINHVQVLLDNDVRPRSAIATLDVLGGILVAAAEVHAQHQNEVRPCRDGAAQPNVRSR